MTLPSKNDGDNFDVSEYNEIRKRLIDQADAHVNPAHERYGAAFDGSTDDSSAWSSALTDLSNNGGGVLTTPPGTTLVQQGFTLPDNVLLNLNPGTVIKAHPDFPSQTDLFLISGGSNIIIQGGTLDGDKASMNNERHQGIRVEGESQDIWFKNVIAQNWKQDDADTGQRGDGFQIGQAGTTPENIHLIGCISRFNERQGLSITSGKHIHVLGGNYNGQTGSSLGYGIDIEPNNVSDVMEDVTIIGSHVFGNTGGGITVGGKTSGLVVIKGCTLRGNGDSGTASNIRTRSTAGTVIQGNEVVGSKGIGIHVLGGEHVVVKGNYLEGGTDADERDLLRLQDFNHVTIAGNDFKESQKFAIRCDQDNVGSGAVRGLTIEGNRFLDCVDAGDTAIIQLRGEGSTPSTIQDGVLKDNIVIDTRSGAARADAFVNFDTIGTTTTWEVGPNYVTNLPTVYQGDITQAQSTELITFLNGLRIGSSGADITGHLRATNTNVNFPSIADGATSSTTVTVTGATLEDEAQASIDVAVPAGAALVANVTSSDTVTVTLINHTGGALDLAEGDVSVTVWQH